MKCTGSGWQCDGNPSPIIIDTKQEGFHLTDLKHGVRFGFFPDKPPVQIGWTDASFSNGFLALDRNGNGVIDDGTELFGNLTPQPASATPNGFIALAVYDQPSQGGNGNGVIDSGDAIYSRLRVWIDANHNGVSEPAELHTLRELHITKIGLTYELSPYTDEYGNQFRYQAKIWDDLDHGRENCYDVFLIAGASRR